MDHPPIWHQGSTRLPSPAHPPPVRAQLLRSAVAQPTRSRLKASNAARVKACAAGLPSELPAEERGHPLRDRSQPRRMAILRICPPLTHLDRPPRALRACRLTAHTSPKVIPRIATGSGAAQLAPTGRSSKMESSRWMLSAWFITALAAIWRTYACAGRRRRDHSPRLRRPVRGRGRGASGWSSYRGPQGSGGRWLSPMMQSPDHRSIITTFQRTSPGPPGSALPNRMPSCGQTRPPRLPRSPAATRVAVSC